MNTIDILIEGYAKITDGGWKASGTTTLIITDSGLKIIADPGANRDLLFERLKERRVGLEDIDYVFLTHHHLDHAMNVGLFPQAKVVDQEAIYVQDKAQEGPKMIPDTDITILPTPGHEVGHGILVVPTAQGTVVVAGDNFWWTAEEEQKLDINKQDDFAEDMEILKASRKQVLDLADWVVPGHGKIFEKKRIDR